MDMTRLDTTPCEPASNQSLSAERLVSEAMPLDRTGRPVTVGTRVRVLEIAAFLERDLPPDEWVDLQSMVGGVFEVYEVDEAGAAWVEKVWDEGDGGTRSHSLALDSHEMEWCEGAAQQQDAADEVRAFTMAALAADLGVSRTLIRSGSTAGGAVTADQLEPTVLSSLTGDPAARGEALDALLGALLAEFMGLSPRCTDGVVILREDLGATNYFAVGTVFMIKDQARQPVAIELGRASAGGGLESGRIRIGIAGDASGWQRKYDRVENALLATPHETAAALAWATLFERDATGWHQGTFQIERSGMAG